MTRIELGSPSISQKKHLIGYWVSDDPDLSIITKLTESHYETRSASTVLINKWSGSGTYKGISFTIDITEELPTFTFLYAHERSDTVIVITHSPYGDAKYSKGYLTYKIHYPFIQDMGFRIKSSDSTLESKIVRKR